MVYNISAVGVACQTYRVEVIPCGFPDMNVFTDDAVCYFGCSEMLEYLFGRMAIKELFDLR